ncbi:hypothetical protein NXS08_02880 [Gleimia sp. 6138-11-ORH1]|uniref:hypothetical protein n=1 Tax=Gleimia sp. 6138-11-ORH1 TaxID=2973937 RepID=UPI002169755F|nr:hypothetical protein [Gleimia sp. 6138-11-ORH1]MCS4484432.1 hypothetical protein [Gleimia sp. 6138-11-ORH1]
MAEKKRHQTTPVAKCIDRATQTVRGKVVSITYPASETSPAVKVALRDKTGTLLISWLGRKTLGGVNVGDILEVTGIVSTGSGHPQMLNPRYQVLEDYSQSYV